MNNYYAGPEYKVEDKMEGTVNQEQPHMGCCQPMPNCCPQNCCEQNFCCPPIYECPQERVCHKYFTYEVPQE